MQSNPVAVAQSHMMQLLSSSIDPMPVVFTAQSKRAFYCRDAVCEYAMARKVVPINPFRAFEYFLGDRVARSVVRQANSSLIARSDELWVFGSELADGVVFEISYASQLKLPIRLFTISDRADEIRPAATSLLTLEKGVSERAGQRDKEVLREVRRALAEVPSPIGG